MNLSGCFFSKSPLVFIWFYDPILDAAETVLGYFGFDRNIYGDKKNTGVGKWKWNIKGTDEPGEKKGTITGGTIDKTKYDLKGKEAVDSLCEGKVPKDITISGDCGNNKQVNFRIIAGSHEVFNGLAECS